MLKPSRKKERFSCYILNGVSKESESGSWKHKIVDAIDFTCCVVRVCVCVCVIASRLRSNKWSKYIPFYARSWILTYNAYKSFALNVSSIWFFMIVRCWCCCWHCFCCQAICTPEIRFVFHIHLRAAISFHWLPFGLYVPVCLTPPDHTANTAWIPQSTYLLCATHVALKQKT